MEDRECKEADKLSVFEALLSIWSIYPSAPRLHQVHNSRIPPELLSERSQLQQSALDQRRVMQIASKFGQLPLCSHISLVEHGRSLSCPSNTTTLVMAESLAGRCEDSSSSQQVAGFLANLANRYGWSCSLRHSRGATSADTARPELSGLHVWTL